MIENVNIRPLQESDLPQADRILRLAFGTFVGLPDPMTFLGDADVVRTRFLANPSGALAAEINGELVGSNFVTNWGSVGFFGPLSIRPDLWDRGVAKRLVESTINLFEEWVQSMWVSSPFLIVQSISACIRNSASGRGF